MAEVVVKTRITPKKLTENIVSRQRLLNKITENASKNLILITGPAGYGKTTLVLDYLNAKQYAWLYASADIDNFHSFINYIVHSLKNINNKFGDKTLELADSFSQSDLFNKDGANSINAGIGTFVNEFVSVFEDDIYLVIDDLHNITGTDWLNTAFNSLIESFPANLHIIITSRSVPDFNIARLSAKRNLLKIESSDLNFNHDETEKLLKDIYSVSYNKDDLKLLENKIEGWITGLHLILQAYGDDFPKITSSKQVIDENIFGYFAEDIYNKLDENVQDFIVSTSLLDSFTPETCDEILQTKGSKKILEDLKKKNIFIESAVFHRNDNTALTSYSYHNLFKQFLTTKLHEAKTENDIKSLAERIFTHYQKNGDYTQAIEFSLYAKDYQKSSELITEHYERLLQEGRYELLWRWLGQLPKEIIDSNVELLFLKGKLLRFIKNDLEESLKIFKTVKNEAAKNESLYVSANSEISEILHITGKPEEALNIFKELYKLNTSPEIKVKIIISLARAYYRLGSKHYDEIIKLLDEGFAISEKNNLQNAVTDIYGIYGRVYLNKGDFIKSLHYFESAVKRENNIYKKFQTINNIVLMYAWSGQYKKAKKYFDETTEIYHQYNAPIFERDLVKLTAFLKFEAGDYEDAVKKFSELAAADLQNNIKSSLPTYYFFICESHIFLNEKDRAKEYLEFIEKIKEPNDEYLQVEYDHHTAIIEPLKGVNQTEKILLSTLKYYESLNSLYSKTQVQFHLADYYYKKGNTQTALSYLLECLNTASEKQYNSFLAQHFMQMRYLFDFALGNNIHKDYINTIYNIVIDRNSYEWLSDECRKRLNKEKIGLYDIYLSTFGGTEIFVRGNLIPEDKWIRKKSKMLLVYLLINQGVKIQKDKVLGLFFSELSANSAENVFHQAITNIRNAVKPETEIKPAKEAVKSKTSSKKSENIVDFSPSYIIYEDKILHMASGYDYKVDVIEFNKMANIVKSSETDENIKEKTAKEAIELYKGEFLPGYYDDWIEELRTVLEHKHIELCEELISILRQKNKYDEVIYYSEKLLQADALHEDAYIAAIDAYSRSGNQNMAKKKFSQLLKNYDAEYGEKPSKDVLSQIEKILTT